MYAGTFVRMNKRTYGCMHGGRERREHVVFFFIETKLKVRIIACHLINPLYQLSKKLRRITTREEAYAGAENIPADPRPGNE